MKKTWPLLLLSTTALAQTPPAKPAAAPATPSRIEQVLVYPGGATVERSVAVKAGQPLLRLSCLSARFDVDSLQLQAEGVTIGEISVQTVDRATLPECADNTPLDARIRELEEQRNAVQNEIAAHEVALGYMKQYNAGSTAIAATAESLRRAGLETLQRQAPLQRRRDEIERQLAPLVGERDRLRQAEPQLRTLQVRLSAARDTEMKLSYRVGQAGWEPVYRAYLDSESGKVRLERHAQVAQNSGEDWSDVKLRLSTAQPRAATGMPPPQPWTLDLLPPAGNEARPVAAYAPPPAPAPAMRSAERGGAAPDLGFNVGVFQGEFATEFEVPGRVGVSANGQRIALSLGQQQLDSRFLARVNPRAEAQAYLVAESARPQGVWPAGALQLFRDGAFIGQSRLVLGNSDKLDLFFGRDERLRVAVEPEQRNAANTGFVGNRAEQKIARVYKIENLHGRPFTVQLLEPAPVGRHEDIKVQAVFEPKPAELEWRKQPGVAAWELQLAPGASQQIRADYTISYPKDARISGMR
ncbi:DUF4139 domain-containing protein [Roseateles violae]|uniref:DUF4139 domain-containing protein n=1 Tax=Roseateles violae TaxID=3058042 RepID=A0ABT8DR43_9BURK|nr:DUF4139 domain-containing protein [Pelomonas sp. PFR6]MDN3918749.1 DUF4139 domain-containing protein [Pelomonas sp. PFR6]